MKPSQVVSTFFTQGVRTGSKSWKSDEPPALNVVGLALASPELQKGFDLGAAPVALAVALPKGGARKAGSEPMPTAWPETLPLVPLPAGGATMLVKASVVPE